MAKIRVSALFSYLFKSGAGASTSSLQITERGPVKDRVFGVVNKKNRILTARSHPRLVRILAWYVGEELKLSLPNGDSIQTAVCTEGKGFEAYQNETKQNRLVLLQSQEADRWISKVLDCDVRLVRFHPNDPFRVNRARYDGEATTTLTDGFPELLISDASLAELERQLPEHKKRCADQRRFRAAMWVSGCQPHEEDSWARICIGGRVEFAVVDLCGRCNIIKIDPETGEQDSEGEPWNTLATYRTQKTRGQTLVTFGQNLVHLNYGHIFLEDEIEVLAYK